MRAGAVLLAAGSGSRFGKGRPKQLHLLGNRPLFYWPLRTLSRIPEIAEIVLVAPQTATGLFERWVGKWRFRTLKSVVPGGSTRNESVCRGIQALSADLDVVLVHDAARPLVSSRLILDVLKASQAYGASLAAIPVKDTLKRERPGSFVKETVKRDGLWMAQTPQAFRMNLAARWFAKPAISVTDDVQVFEKSNVRVKLVPGSPMNLKVTYPEDLELCRSYWQSGRSRS